MLHGAGFDNLSVPAGWSEVPVQSAFWRNLCGVEAAPGVAGLLGDSATLGLLSLLFLEHPVADALCVRGLGHGKVHGLPSESLNSIQPIGGVPFVWSRRLPVASVASAGLMC